MRLRGLQIASLVLLLASLSAAEGSIPRHSEYLFGSHFIGVLLAQQEAAACAPATLLHPGGDALAFDLPATLLAQCRNPWTMRPPSAHSADVHAVTGSTL